MSNAQLDEIVNQFNAQPIPDRPYFNLNRTALRNALREYWCSAPFAEMTNILRWGMRNAGNIPELSALISKLTAISVSSVEGNVFLGGVQHVDKLLVIKYNKPDQDPYSNNIEALYDIKREFVIGLLLNLIRDRVCNFVYTYATVDCHAKSDPVKGEPAKFCEEGPDTTVAQHNLLEYVQGVPLVEICGSLDARELARVLLCIFCAMAIANNTVGFCHYDLHCGNVMIKTEPRPVTMRYVLPDNSTIIVNTKYVPVIIDYGFARASHNGVTIAGGVGRITPLVGRETESHPYIDWYKLISHLIFTHGVEGTLTPDKRTLFTGLINYFNNRFANNDGIRLTNAVTNSNQLNRAELQRIWFYPQQNSIQPISFMDCVAPLRQFQHTHKVSSIRCTPIETLISQLYPQERLPCGGEDGNPFDKNGVYRGIFDCAKYFYDGRYNVVEFQTGMSIYHGSPALAYYNSEFPLGPDYYTSRNKQQNRGLLLTGPEKEELKNNRGVEEILQRTQPIKLSYYGDFNIAQTYSNGAPIEGFRCGTKCTHAYKFTKNATFLDLSDPYTLRRLLDIMKLSEQFLFTLYHGESYNYTDQAGHSIRITAGNEGSIRLALSAFVAPDDPNKAHFRQFASQRIDDWKSKFFDTLGILPVSQSDKFKFSLQHGLKYYFRIPDDIRRDPINPGPDNNPNYNWPELLTVGLNDGQSIAFIDGAIRNRDLSPNEPGLNLIVRQNRQIGAVILSQIATALNTWVTENYPNAPAFGTQVSEVGIFNRYHPIKRFMGRRIDHDSMRFPDYIMPNLLMVYAEKLGYAGFAYVQTGRPTSSRFGEVVMGTKVKSFIKRDYNNPNDWQYNDDKYLFGSIGNLIKDMKKYKTTNIDFHAGDLLEHSVWTALYVQWMFKTDHPAVAGIADAELRKVIIASAFLHDIGKGGDSVFTYYDKPDHSKTGYEYLRTGNYTTAEHGVINLNTVIAEMGIAPSMIEFIKFLVRFHWDIGDVIRKNSQATEEVLANAMARRFAQMCEELRVQTDINGKKVLFMSLYALWSADVMASQPFIGKAKLAELTQKIATNEEYAGYYMNEYLEEFPYIANLPKIHRGDDKYREFGIQDVDMATGEYANTGKGIRLRANVLRLIGRNVA